MEEETYKMTVWLIDGTKIKVYGPQLASSVQKFYECIGVSSTTSSRVKVPTGPNKMQFIPASSVLRFEAVGNFS